MLQQSKILRSRDEWRAKAIERADENREHRKTEGRHQETIAELKRKIKELEHEADEGKKKTSPPTVTS